MILFSFEYFIFLLNLFFYDLLLHSTLDCKSHLCRTFHNVSSIFAITPRKARDIPDHVFCSACPKMSLDSVLKSAIVGHRLCAFSNPLGILIFFPKRLPSAVPKNSHRLLFCSYLILYISILQVTWTDSTLLALLSSFPPSLPSSLV